MTSRLHTAGPADDDESPASPHPAAHSRENSLLAALSQKVRAVLLPRMRARVFRAGEVLWDVGTAADHTYFPETGMIAVVVPAKNGNALQVGSVGHEGGIGFHDRACRHSMTRGVVQMAGTFVVLSVREHEAAVQQSESVRRLENICNGWLLVQAQQIAVCNATHSADGRFGHWLLRLADATASDVLSVTHEVAAEMWGLRRTTITVIAQNLQNAGIIRYRRGIISIRDRAGLENAACDCRAMTTRKHWPSEVVKAARASEHEADTGFD